MLEIIMGGHILYVCMGIFAAIGILSKVIVNISLKRLVRASGNMNKSDHPLIRLIRAKFEHACMISDTVDNVSVFVDKYLYEYRVIGVKLHSWRRLEKMAAGICLLLGAAGAGLEYSINGMNDRVLRIGATGAVFAIFVYLVHLTTDESYRMQAVKNYMVDYLENVCRRRYEKAHRKEIQVMSPEMIPSEMPVKQMTEETARPAQGLPRDLEPAAEKEQGYGGTTPVPAQTAPMRTQEEPRQIQTEESPEPEIKQEMEKPPVDKEVRIRQILEEFMA